MEVITETGEVTENTDLVLNKCCTEFESLFKAESKGFDDVFLSDIKKQL